MFTAFIILGIVSDAFGTIAGTCEPRTCPCLVIITISLILGSHFFTRASGIRSSGGKKCLLAKVSPPPASLLPAEAKGYGFGFPWTCCLLYLV